ncbi:MAG: bifunctional riboflavin kinase/FAD synthetase [Hyphomicrobiales bacterium]|nr:bifunctional riboflavin kinase/FAD synthetase [Hyphomicrobiales bacterium]MDE2113765.1 bifunctional riboflavin kinase/FAD synthetase [Hyphomicrobiales bacterium]
MPQPLRACVVAIGNFDGVHRGHRAVIAKARALARELERPCAVLTFEPHPADFFAKRSVIFRLSPLKAKARALARLHLDGMIVLAFDAAMANLTAAEFVEQVLVQRLGVAAVVAGYDFHFGKARAGTPEYLAQAGIKHGFCVEIVAPIHQDAQGSIAAVSSTATRQALAQGDVAKASELLGHDYFVIGEVQHGQKLGRTLGFPTANLIAEPSSQLRAGIYAVRVWAQGRKWDGVASYGRRPTFDNGATLLEVFLFDFTGDLYGEEIEVSFVAWLREEKAFASADALVAQMNQDVADAKRALANTGTAQSDMA